jgi:hypothetical protein
LKASLSFKISFSELYRNAEILLYAIVVLDQKRKENNSRIIRMKEEVTQTEEVLQERILEFAESQKIKKN